MHWIIVRSKFRSIALHLSHVYHLSWLLRARRILRHIWHKHKRQNKIIKNKMIIIKNKVNWLINWYVHALFKICLCRLYYLDLEWHYSIIILISKFTPFWSKFFTLIIECIFHSHLAIKFTGSNIGANACIEILI